jgi:hypothetical protein
MYENSYEKAIRKIKLIFHALYTFVDTRLRKCRIVCRINIELM